MGRLHNARYERFAQALADGKPAYEAYESAGYKPDRGHASRLAANGSIRARVAEIQETAAKKVESSLERVLHEQHCIGFSDIRRVVKWRGAVTEIRATKEDGSIEIVLRSENQVTIIDSNEISRETAAAIQEVSQAKDGSIRIKLHPKQPALAMLCEYHKAIEDLRAQVGQPQLPPATNNVVRPDFAAATKKFGA